MNYSFDYLKKNISLVDYLKKAGFKPTKKSSQNYPTLFNENTGELFIIKENDTSPDIMAVLKSPEGEVIDLSGAQVKTYMSDYSGEEIIINADAQIIDALEGKVVYSWTEGDTQKPGRYKLEFEVTFADGKVQTYPNQGYIEIEITEDIV